LKSEEGKGSTFWFEIPLIVSKSSAHFEPNKSQNSENYNPHKKLYILVIDDNDINLKIVSSLLEMDGHEVVTASSGEKGLQLINNDRFDVVFVDMIMPEMDGKAFLEKLRQNPHPVRANIPVYALTGIVEKEAVKEILEIGMMGVISKPVTHASLRQAIDAIVKTVKSIPAEIQISDIVAKLDTFSEEDKEKLREALLGSTPLQTSTAPQMQPVETNPDLLNMAILNDLKQSLPSDTFTELFDDLVAKSREITEQLFHAHQANDFEDMGNMAHNLRGMAGNFGLQGLMEHSGKIEDAVRANDNEKAATLVQSSRIILNQSLATLDQWMKN